MFKKLFCSHDYNIIKELNISSEFDIVCENNRRPTTWNSRKRKHILVFKCTKCKKLKIEKFVTEH